MYLDEVDAFHLNPKIGPEWTLAGKQKYVRTPGCNEKRYLAGALNPKTGKLTWVEGDRKNSLLFLELLYKLVTETYGTLLESTSFLTTTASMTANRSNWP